MRQLTQSTAANIMVFMTGSTDHTSGLSGLTLTITASNNGAAFAAIMPTVTDRGSGWYNLALTTSHTDTLGDLALHITATGSDSTDLVMSINAAAAGGSADWSAGEREQIRQALGITGTKTATSGGNIDTIITKLPTNNIMGSGVKIDKDSVIDAIKTKTDNLPADPASNTQVNTRMATFSYTAPDNANIVNIKAKTDNLPSDPADESLLEAAISTRMAAGSYVAPDNANIAAIKAKTDNLPSGVKKNTALSNFSFAMTDKSTHYSFVAGQVITGARSIDGGAFAACTNSVVEIGAGVYKIDLSAADLNGNVIVLRFIAAGADDRLITIVTEA
jgi:hypothetical protein